MRKKRVSCFSYVSHDEFLARNSSGDNTSFLNTSILMLLIRIRFEYNFKLVSNRTQLRSTSWTEEGVTTSLCWSHLSTSSSVKLGSRFVKKSKPQRRSSGGKFCGSLRKVLIKSPCQLNSRDTTRKFLKDQITSPLVRALFRISTQVWVKRIVLFDGKKWLI